MIRWIKRFYSGFNKRRKTILNSLSAAVNKDDLKKVLEEVGLKENLRAENLSLDDFIRLAKAIENHY